MPRKKKTTSRPKGEIIVPKNKVNKTVTNERVDEIGKEIAAFTYGQCLILKRELDKRIAATRSYTLR